MVGAAGSFLCQESGLHRWEIAETSAVEVFWRMTAEGFDTGEVSRSSFYHPAVHLTSGYRYRFRLMTTRPTTTARFVMEMALPNHTTVGLVGPWVETCEVNGCADMNAVRQDKCVVITASPTPGAKLNKAAVIVVVVVLGVVLGSAIIVLVILVNKNRRDPAEITDE
jgi:hypothetical protein